MGSPELITLDEAVRKYPISKRTIRHKIATGELPASKPGRALLICDADLARLLAPTLRTAVARPKPESPTARAKRQLRSAGLQI